MRYAVPVNGACEVESLVEAGADELYCGVLEEAWARRWGTHDSASRRQGAANLASRRELAEVVRRGRAVELPTWLALNARYTEPQLDVLEDLAADFADCGGAGLIVSDLGLVWRLREHGFGLPLTLSLLAVAQNVETLDAWRRLGVSRVVLPRFVGPAEAGELLAGTRACAAAGSGTGAAAGTDARVCAGTGDGAAPLEAEVMAFFDKCRWVDGFCRHPHLVAWPDRPEGTLGDAPPLRCFDTTYRTHACLAATGGEAGPACGACALARFAAAGVGTAKLGGRGRPLAERVAALSHLRAAEGMASDEERMAAYQRRFGVPCRCYFGDAIQSRDAIESRCHLTCAGRHYLGSETSWRALVADLESLASGEEFGGAGPVSLLLPPLSQERQQDVLSRLPVVCAALPSGSHVVANDLGTLVILSRKLTGADVELTMGSLLARVDDPCVVAHWTSAEENPPRPVWGPGGKPRTLVWEMPADDVLAHVRTPSATGPSAQAALQWLSGRDGVRYEFART